MALPAPRVRLALPRGNEIRPPVKRRVGGISVRKFSKGVP